MSLKVNIFTTLISTVPLMGTQMIPIQIRLQILIHHLLRQVQMMIQALAVALQALQAFQALQDPLTASVSF